MKLRTLCHIPSLAMVICALAYLFGQPGLVSASQGAQAITLQSVRVQIWPEYDKPSALIIYNVTLPATVSLPASLTLRIPTRVGKPNAVAWQSTDKALYEIKYDASTAGDWIQIKFSTPAQDFRVEYYDPTLVKSGTKRNFTFRWPGDYAVDNLTLEIQQPVNASGMTFTPSVGPGQVSSSDGLTYYNLLAGKVNAGTTFDLSMTYNKSDDSLTSPSQYQAAKANQPVTGTTSGRVIVDQMLPWIIGGVGLLLIAAGLFWYYRSGRVDYGKTSRGRTRHGHRNVAVSAASVSSAGSSGVGSATSAEDEIIFCTQCGKRAAPGDAFCRACGTKLAK